LEYSTNLSERAFRPNGLIGRFSQFDQLDYLTKWTIWTIVIFDQLGYLTNLDNLANWDNVLMSYLDNLGDWDIGLISQLDYLDDLTKFFVQILFLRGERCFFANAKQPRRFFVFGFCERYKYTQYTLEIAQQGQ
jgi:hypothetical protein